MQKNLKIRNNQRGATLIVALIIMIVLMLLGIAAVMTSNTQFKLAGNLQFQNAAKNKAENEIARIEDWLSEPGNALNACFTTYGSGCGKVYPIGQFSTVPDPRNIIDSSNDYMVELIGEKIAPPGAGLGDVCGSPGIAFDLNLYRITTVGTDARGATRYIQSVFQTRIPCGSVPAGGGVPSASLPA